MDNSTSQFWSGVRSIGVPLAAAAPFGALFGALAVDGGLSFVQTMLMSMLVFAGASQMVGLELFGASVAPWLVVLSIFAVNFRHVLYSAVIGRRTPHFTAIERAVGFFFLIDPQFAETERRAERGDTISFAWFMGGAVGWWVSWQIVTAIGAYFGRFIGDPKAIGVDFLLPLYFLVLVMGFRRRVNWLPVVAASAVASVLAYKFIGTPWHVSFGAIAGVAVAAWLGVPRHRKLQV